MIPRHLLVALLLLVPAAGALVDVTDEAGNIRVQVNLSGVPSCGIRPHVFLMAAASAMPVAEGYTDDDCMVGFNHLATGTYYLFVSGEGIVGSTSGTFAVDSVKAGQLLHMTVEPAKVEPAETAKDPLAPTVAAADLSIPNKARKAYQRAAVPIAKGDWYMAKDRLLKALAIYPDYAAAYNDLAVVYARLGDPVGEREALQKAVRVNDHFVPAVVNLAKLEVSDRNFSAAEELLRNASVADPKNPQILMLLANVELLARHFTDAIAHCRKVHALPHSAQALAHYIAARALQQENRPADAAIEFQSFLTEQPWGPDTEAAWKELAALQATQPATGEEGLSELRNH